MESGRKLLNMSSKIIVRINTDRRAFMDLTHVVK